MRRKIPSIEALIAFESAARYQSFTRAADELSLTQSAVGRQIALLEDYLGVPLFSRIKKRVMLTAVGETYARQVREDLARVERHTVAAMAHHGSGGVLELAVIPTFAVRWLIPRLPQFYAGHPDITLNLTTRAEPFLFTDTPFDAAIHRGSPVWPGTVAEHLFGEELIPVCSPALLGGTSLPLPPVELGRFKLMHQSSRPEMWREWFTKAGLHEINSMSGQRFELFSMLVEAARAGLGVALVPRFLVQKELANRSLVIPCELSLHSEKAYYLVYPASRQSCVWLRAFRVWLLEVATEFSGVNRAA